MSGTFKVTLVRSMIGRPEKHRRVLRGMGLTKLSIRGMVNTVSHLVKVEEKSDETK